MDRWISGSEKGSWMIGGWVGVRKMGGMRFDDGWRFGGGGSKF